MAYSLSVCNENNKMIHMLMSACCVFISAVPTGFMSQSIILHLPLVLLLIYVPPSWVMVWILSLFALFWWLCVMSDQAARSHGVHKEQRGKRPGDEVSARELHDARSQHHSHHTSRRSLRTGSNTAAAEPTSVIHPRLWGRKLQPHPNAVRWILLCHNAIWRGFHLLHRPSVQLLLWCRLKWAMGYCRIPLDCCRPSSWRA